MTEQQVKDNLSDDELKLLAKSLYLYGDEGVMDEYFSEFIKFIEPFYKINSLNVAISIITSEVLRRYSTN